MSQNSVDTHPINFLRTVTVSLAHVKYNIACDVFTRPNPVFLSVSCPSGGCPKSRAREEATLPSLPSRTGEASGTVSTFRAWLLLLGFWAAALEVNPGSRVCRWGGAHLLRGDGWSSQGSSPGAGLTLRQLWLWLKRYAALPSWLQPNGIGLWKMSFSTAPVEGVYLGILPLLRSEHVAWAGLPLAEGMCLECAFHSYA